MKQVPISSRFKSWMVGALVLSTTLTVFACDNDVNINPVGPALPKWTLPNATTARPGRSLEIRGSLTATQGSCIEAAVLYDGKEVAGGRTACREESGCAQLELNANVDSTNGHHTISFQVVSQSPETVEYIAEGEVLVTRDHIPFAMTLDLDPIRVTLRPGESVTFEVDFMDWEN
jgi:hypothetical protein